MMDDMTHVPTIIHAVLLFSTKKIVEKKTARSEAAERPSTATIGSQLFFDA